MVKNLSASAGDAIDSGSIPGLGKSPGGGNGNGQRSLAGYSLRDCKESDMTEHTHGSHHVSPDTPTNLKSRPRPRTAQGAGRDLHGDYIFSLCPVPLPRSPFLRYGSQRHFLLNSEL